MPEDKTNAENSAQSEAGAPVAVETDMKKLLPGWKHMLLYVPWFIPTIVFIIFWSIAWSIIHSGGPDGGGWLTIIFVPLGVIIGIVAVVCAEIGMTFCAMFVYRKKGIVWTVPIILLAIALVLLVFI